MNRPRRSLAAAFVAALALHPPSVAHASWASDRNLLVGGVNSPVSPTVVAGAENSVFLAWLDGRSGVDSDLRASRWTAGGVAASGWTGDGDLVAEEVCLKSGLCAAPDGLGGALYAWSDLRCLSYRQGYASHALPARATAGSWGTERIPVATTTADQSAPAIAGDGAGGAFVAWQDLRGADADVYLQHVTGGGALAAGWAANGIAVCNAPGDQRGISMVGDDASGVFIAWQDHRALDWDLYALRVLGNAVRAPGWVANGVAVTQAGDDQLAVRAARDGAHGVLLAWQDHRGADWDVYALRLAADASVAPAW